jgi:hypothetical protein
MPTAYHKQVEGALRTLGIEWAKQGKIKEVYRGSEKPLSIVDSTSRRVVNYQPDVYYILRNNKKLLFEVLDTELQKQESIIADVICAFLIENVDGLIFLFPSGSESDERRISDVVFTIYGNLLSRDVRRSTLPSRKKSGAYVVTKEEAADTQKIRAKLTEYANEENWFKTLPTSKKLKVAKR